MSNAFQVAAVPRFIVVTANAPGPRGVGAILIAQILSALPRDRYRVVTLVELGQQSEVSGNPHVDASFVRRFERGVRSIGGYLGAAISMLTRGLMLRAHIGILRRRISAYARVHECRAVLAILDSPSVIGIAENVARDLGAPLHCFVMDAPGPLLAAYGLDSFSASWLLRRFDSAMRLASRLGVSGESMREEYGRIYRKPAAILRQGATTVATNRVRDLSDHVIRIGFAGSLSGADAFFSMLSELDARNWSIGGRPVVLRFIGSHLRVVRKEPCNIEFLGWRAEDDLVKLLSECHYLYLPQPFDEAQEEIARLSFPNKLCTYVAAARPVLLHAPAQASLVAFFDRFPCGPVSSSLNATELVDKLSECVSNPEIYAKYVDNVRRAFDEELNQLQLSKAAGQFLAPIDANERAALADAVEQP